MKDRYSAILATADHRLALMGDADTVELEGGVVYSRRMMENMRAVALEGLSGHVEAYSEEKHTDGTELDIDRCSARGHALDADERSYYEVTGKIFCKQCITERIKR